MSFPFYSHLKLYHGPNPSNLAVDVKVADFSHLPYLYDPIQATVLKSVNKPILMAHFRAALLATGSKLLVECAPRDTRQIIIFNYFLL